MNMCTGSGFAVLRNPLLVVAIIVLAIKCQSPSTPAILYLINIEDELAQKADEAREQYKSTN